MKIKKISFLFTLCAAMVAFSASGCQTTTGRTTGGGGGGTTGGGGGTTGGGGGGDIVIVDEDYYKAANGLTGSNLSSKLKEINKPKSKSYDWYRYEAADESPNDPTCIISLYTRHDIKKSSHCGNYAWDKWNREHVFVQSTYTQSTTDNHNIFACEGQINNVRGNLPFGEVDHTSSYRVSVFGHQTDCYCNKKVFEPCNEAKGEVARALLYGTLTYNYNIEGMISLKTALKWHATYSVTERETKRNDTVYKLQGNRNPFVDHPEYATAIWGTY